MKVMPSSVYAHSQWLMSENPVSPLVILGDAYKGTTVQLIPPSPIYVFPWE